MIRRVSLARNRLDRYEIVGHPNLIDPQHWEVIKKGVSDPLSRSGERIV